MVNGLAKYLPENAFNYVKDLLSGKGITLIVKPERKTKHGDYRLLSNGGHQITINGNLNPYRFLITLVHEVAHLEAFKRYGRKIKPHGKAWKYTFKELMLPLINPEVFPNHLLPLLARHFKNPKATSDTDTELSLALKQFDAPSNKQYVFQLAEGTSFKMYNGRVFKKGAKRTKRIECIEIATGRMYLFNPSAEVEIV